MEAAKITGDDSARVHPQGQVCGLSAVHPPAHHPLGVLDGDPALSSFHDHDSDHHQNHHRQEDDDREDGPGSQHPILIQGMGSGRQADHDAGEDDQGDPVSNAALGDLLAEPHHQRRPAGEGEHGHESKTPARIRHHRRNRVHAFQDRGGGHTLEQAEAHGQVSSVLIDLFSTQLTFLGEPLQEGPDHRQQLQDDGRGDVGSDSQGKDGESAQVAPREHVQEAQDGPGLLAEDQFQGAAVHSRSRDPASHPVRGQEPQHEEDPLP